MPHCFVEAHPSVEHSSRYQASGLAEVAEQVLKRRIGARGIAEFGKAKLVDIRIGPGDFRPGKPQGVPKSLEKTWLHPIVGIEEINALKRRKGGEGEIYAAVAGRAEPAVALAKVVHSLQIARREFAAHLIGLIKWAAVVNDDDDVGEVRLLGEGGVERLDQEAR